MDESEPWIRPKQAKLTPEDRDRIRELARHAHPNLKDIAEFYGIHKSTVAAIRDRDRGYRHY